MLELINTVSASSDPDTFLGVVQSVDFISGSALSEAVGFTEGVLINDDIPWFNIDLDGTVIFIPMKPIRSTFPFTVLENRKLVTGDTVLEIQGQRYKVRLLSGAGVNPTTMKDHGHEESVFHSELAGSEWNRTMYRLIPKIWVGQTQPSWAAYTEEDLGHTANTGRYQWTSTKTVAGMHLMRGYFTRITGFTEREATFTHGFTGWRPCLELIG